MDERNETTQPQRQAMVEDLRVMLASAKHLADEITDATGKAGLHTACAGWETLRRELDELLYQARRLPK
jgi:hypothetical protein